MADNQNSPGATAEFTRDFVHCWNQLPNKALFFALLAAWFVFFQFLGNATLGYIDTASLYRWMWNSYRDDLDGTGDSQGKLVPFIVVGLLWWKRKQLLAQPGRAWWPALVVLAGALLLHITGYMVQQPRISIVGFFIGIYALVGLAWGPRWLKASFFPLFLFVFSVPVSSIATPVTFRLRLLVASLVHFICNHVLGVSVVREGTQLFNSTHTYGYDVAAACSGLRSFIAILALSTVYGFMSFTDNRKRLVMILAAFPLAVLGNTLRMLCIVVAAELGGQAWGDFVHENFFFSLLPYVPAILGLLALGHWLRERTPAASPSPEAKAS